MTPEQIAELAAIGITAEVTDERAALVDKNIKQHHGSFEQLMQVLREENGDRAWFPRGRGRPSDDPPGED